MNSAARSPGRSDEIIGLLKPHETVLDALRATAEAAGRQAQVERSDAICERSRCCLKVG